MQPFPTLYYRRHEVLSRDAIYVVDHSVNAWLSLIESLERVEVACDHLETPSLVLQLLLAMSGAWRNLGLGMGGEYLPLVSREEAHHTGSCRDKFYSRRKDNC
jgi:hypothetical protein